MRAFVWLVSALVAVLATACGGCSDPCDDIACVNGTCVDGMCVVTVCEPECGPDEQCRSGICVPTATQCAAAGEECNAYGDVADPFICLDLDGFGGRPGVCVEPCAANGQCDAGSLCFYLSSSSAGPSCATSADCAEHHECSFGECLRTICRPSECDGFVSGAETCDDFYGGTAGYPDGTQCYNVGNGARYCYPAGPKQEGEACGAAIDAIVANNFANTCGSGLACVDNVCRVACTDDATCGDLQCILHEQNLVDTGTGMCGASCTPFEVGTCGDGQSCVAITATEGICMTAGDRGAFEPCDPGMGQCVDGHVCVTFQSDPVVAQCQPACNLTVGAPNDNGTVGELAQAQRDATCPQGAVSDANVLVTNLAEVGAEVDVYLGGAALTGVALDASTPWAAVAAGAVAVRVLPAGAASTDVPLVEQTLSLTGGESTRIFVVPTTSPDEAKLHVVDVSRLAQPSVGVSRLRVAVALPDAPTVDVVLVPPGDDLSDPTNAVDLVLNGAEPSWSAPVEVAATDWDLLVFAAGDARTDRTSALLGASFTLTDRLDYTVALRGTLDPDDLVGAAAVLLVDGEVPDVEAGGVAFTCVDPGGGVVGFCQQRCDGARGFDGRCEGEGNGCTPTFLSANNAWAGMCAPLGEKSLDEQCDPFAQYSECGEGMYCLEYGNTVPNYTALARGRCVSHCVDGVPDDATLRCGAGQACEPISPGYEIGRCGYACTPDAQYEDASCPLGLRACRPTARLIEDASNPNALPAVIAAQSFCAASGDIAAGDRCGGADCVPGAECMFPRSRQLDFTSSMLSQYFGAAGLVPVCTPQCDPFDGDSSSTTCAANETCLFNYPYSAEVGHCAPIEETVAPLAPCSNPGHACGEDSICVVNGTPTCFQFCQYRGPDGAGQPRPESCRGGLVCAPLVNDIGVCLSAG